MEYLNKDSQNDHADKGSRNDHVNKDSQNDYANRDSQNEPLTLFSKSSASYYHIYSYLCKRD